MNNQQQEKSQGSQNSDNNSYYDSNKSLHRSNIRNSIKNSNSVAESIFNNSGSNSEQDLSYQTKTNTDGNLAINSNFEEHIITLPTYNTNVETKFNAFEMTGQTDSEENFSEGEFEDNTTQENFYDQNGQDDYNQNQNYNQLDNRQNHGYSPEPVKYLYNEELGGFIEDHEENYEQFGPDGDFQQLESENPNENNSSMRPYGNTSNNTDQEAKFQEENAERINRIINEKMKNTGTHNHADIAFGGNRKKSGKGMKNFMHNANQNDDGVITDNIHKDVMEEGGNFMRPKSEYQGTNNDKNQKLRKSSKKQTKDKLQKPNKRLTKDNKKNTQLKSETNVTNLPKTYFDLV